MSSAILQKQSTDYMSCIHEVKVIEKCWRKDKATKISFKNEQFVKGSESTRSINRTSQAIAMFSLEELQFLKSKISFINQMNSHLPYALKETSATDFAAVVATSYNQHLKIINKWNALFSASDKDLTIPLINGSNPLEFHASNQSPDQIADEKARKRYFELLNTYPKLRREGDLNDHTKGAYEILYDVERIKEVQKACYDAIYKRLIEDTANPISPARAHAIAVESSRIGVVDEDLRWIWIRDAVISPTPPHVKHTYNRIVLRSDLNQVGGAAALPIIVDELKHKKFVVQLAFRHATGSWELEIPRGFAKPNEASPSDTAKREVREETGCTVKNLLERCQITPDSGLVASIIPIFSGEVSAEEKAQHDKTEAIKGRYTFTYDELIQGIRNGSIMIPQEKDAPIKAHMRDPFLFAALLAIGPT